MKAAQETRPSCWKHQLTARHGLAVLLAVVAFAYVAIPVYSDVVSLVGATVVCLYCFALGPTKVDLRALVGFCLLAAATAVSTVTYFGDISRGSVIFYVLPALYFASSYLGTSGRRLLLKLCVIGAAVVAFVSLVMFSVEAMNDTAWRARAILGSPNALGIFLAIAWLCLLCLREKDRRPLLFLEPILLSCLALTLSGGSLLSLACGLGVVLYREKKTCSWKELGDFVAHLLARMVIAFFLGIMFYIAANRTIIPWFCFVLVGLVVLVSVMWSQIMRLLADCRWLTYAVVLLCGLVFVVALFSFRQSALSTFIERIWMMENGIGYLLYYPLIGLGYEQWPLYNLQDADMYFNVAQIHNTVIHVGVEFGLLAMAAMVYLIVHRFWKGGDNTPGALAFVAHSMLDNPLFTRMALFGLLVCTTPRRKGVCLDAFEARVILFVFLAVLIYCLVRLLMG